MIYKIMIIEEEEKDFGAGETEETELLDFSSLPLKQSRR